MAGSEGVVDVTIGERGHLLGKGEIALLLALVEPDVFEDHDAAGLQVGAGGLRLGTDRVVDLLDRQADQLLKPGGHLVQPERRVGGGVSGGTAQVADQNQAAAAVEDRRQGRQGALDPAIVGNAAVGRLRDVEIDPNQDLLAGHLDVAESLFGHERSSWA